MKTFTKTPHNKNITVLIIILFVMITGFLVWFNKFKYVQPKLVETTTKSVVKKDLPKPYSIKNNKVYIHNYPIVGTTDPETFQYIGHYHYNDYAKDMNSVFFNNRTIDGADPKTFQYVGGGYFKDKNYIYVPSLGYDSNGNYSASNAIIKDANLATFLYLGGVYAKDAYNVFYYNKIIKNVDLATFTYIGGWKKYEYMGPMDDILDEGYAKDKNYAYFYGNNLNMKNIDLATFKDIGGGYAKDKGGVYCNGIIFVIPSDNPYDINSIFTPDVSTFEYIGDHYTKDKNNVYQTDNYCQHNNIVQGAVPSSCTATNITGCKGN